MDTVSSMLTRRFRDTRLREHRESVLLDRERSMLPATQPYIEHRREIKRARERIAAAQRVRDQANMQVALAEHALRRMQVAGPRLDGAPEAEGDEDGGEAGGKGGRQVPWYRALALQPCGAAGCRGFLKLAPRVEGGGEPRRVLQCGVCDARACKDCLVDLPPHTPHTCDPDTVASVSSIALETRPCPRCGVRIQRVSGCNHMFCTAPGCLTGFDWSTGVELKGANTNPHFYEYMRTRMGGAGGAARDPDDIPCGGMPTIRELVRSMATAAITSTSDIETVRAVQRAHRGVSHIRDVELAGRWAAPGDAGFHTNLDLRERFLEGSIDQAAWARALHLRERARQKAIAVHNVLSIIGSVGADTFRGLVINRCSGEACLQALDELRALRDYTNSAMALISREYGCVVPMLRIDWVTESIRASRVD